MTVFDAPTSPSGAPLLEPRGRCSDALLDRLVRPVHDLGRLPMPLDDPIDGEDAPFALYLLYELHYLGLPGVDEGWEWEPSVLTLRRDLERAYEQRLAEIVPVAPLGLSRDEAVAELRGMASGGTGPSLSEFVETDATLAQVRELAVHRSPYQLKEADPHTWGIPRLTGRAKAAMVEIQKGEYGDGDAGAVHATLFADTMRGLDLDPTYGRYLSHVPGLSLSGCNLISLLGLHRRWRGALVGHLAMFEMCSVGPMGRYSNALARLGIGPTARRFYDEHVLADQHHQVVALDEMVDGLIETEPFLSGEVVYGAAALQEVEARFTRHVLGSWTTGVSSLRHPLDPSLDQAS